MAKKVKDITWYVLSFAMAFFLLYYSFRNVDWKDFVSALASCRWGYVIASMILGVAVFYIRGLRWRGYLLPIDPTTGKITCFNAVNIGYLANIVLPRVGEVVRCGYITSHSALDSEGRRKASFDKVAGTVLGDRLWDMLAMGLVILLTMPLMGDRFTTFLLSVNINTPWLIAIVTGVIVLGVLILWALKDRSEIAAKGWGFLKGIGSGLKSSVKMDSWWKFVIYTVLIQVAYVLTSYLIILALEDVIPVFGYMGMTDALFLMVVGSLSTLIPVPGGFGAYHYAVTLALANIYGIPPEDGIVWATLSHESQLLVQILCGGLSFIYESVRK